MKSYLDMENNEATATKDNGHVIELKLPDATPKVPPCEDHNSESEDDEKGCCIILLLLIVIFLLIINSK